MDNIKECKEENKVAFVSKFNPKPAPWMPIQDQDLTDRIVLCNLHDYAGKNFECPEFELKVVPDVTNFFAADLYNRIWDSDRLDKQLVVILPSPENLVYASVTEALNKYRVSCRNVHVFFLYEYANEKGEVIPLDHPYSRCGQFMKWFYDRLDEDLRMPMEQIHFFQDGGKEYTQQLKALGEADVAYTHMTFADGIGAIDAHSCPAKTWEELLQIESGCVTLSLETIAQDSMRGMFGCAGNVWQVPPCAVTVGPRDLVAAKERVDVEFLSACGGNPSPQRTAIKLALLGPVQPENPGALIRTLPGVCYVANSVNNIPNYAGDADWLAEKLEEIRKKEAR